MKKWIELYLKVLKGVVIVAIGLSALVGILYTTLSFIGGLVGANLYTVIGWVISILFLLILSLIITLFESINKL